MIVLTPTKARGAASKASPVVYGEPDRVVTDEQLGRQIGVGPMNGAFVADLLSAFTTHERCGRHLYRSVAGRTNNPMLERRYRHFGDETEHHVEVLEDLVTTAGGNPSYVSPRARAVEASGTSLVESTFLVGGGLDPMAAEMAMLDAVFAAEAVDQANWQAMQKLSEALPVGALRKSAESAVAEVLAQEEEHFEWANDTRAKLTMLQAKSSMAAKAGAKAEELVAQVREWLS